MQICLTTPEVFFSLIVIMVLCVIAWCHGKEASKKDHDEDLARQQVRLANHNAKNLVILQDMNDKVITNLNLRIRQLESKLSRLGNDKR